MGDPDARHQIGVLRAPPDTRTWCNGRQEPVAGGAFSSHAWNVPGRCVVVAGHRQLLATVERTLRAGGRALLCAAESGVGATTAMIEFAHRHVPEYDIVWWVRAVDPELVPDELAALAEALGVADFDDDAETAAARVLRTLRYRDRWLIVFDDAASPYQIARFVPAGLGHVVIISSDPDWRSTAPVHTVEPFTRAESVALLSARRPDLPVADAVEVAAVLEDVPLAVDAAAALLAGNGITAAHLLDLLAEHRAGGRPDPAAAMWTVVFDRLAAEDPVALELLTLVAWLGPDPVPLDVLTGHPHVLPAAVPGRSPTLTDRIVGLHRHGVVRVTTAGVQLPRRPAALLVARARPEEGADDSGTWAGAVVRLLRAAVPENAAGARSSWRRLLPLVLTATDPARVFDGVTADAAWLLRIAASYLHARGQDRTAEVLARDADDLLGLREDRPDRGPAREPALLGTTHRQTGQP
jgi:hypothetical protein